MCQPGIDPCFGEQRLVDLVDGQAEKMIAIHRPRGGEFVTLDRPVADNSGATGKQRIVDEADGIDKFVRVFFLVAQPVDGDPLAGKIGIGQLRQEFLPAWLAEPGRQPR